MKIEKITIKGCSGYISLEYSYNDKLTITKNSISYECKPMTLKYEPATESKIKEEKWSYKTISSDFEEIFDKASEMLEKRLNEEQTEFVEDIGELEFSVTYSDKSKKKYYFCCFNEYFYDEFILLQKLVPQIETLPKILELDFDDYEEFDDVDFDYED